MLKIISQPLRQLADDVDAGKFECDKEQMTQVVTQLADFNTEFVSKAQACDYLNISRSTFDKLIKEGKLPKGKKRMSFKELSWKKKNYGKIK